jgi:DNA polymerase-3 subunit gamma/tau
MLRLLAENEQGIRRSVSPRLVVETLLLRWAMLDRIVDLREVLEVGPSAPLKTGQAKGSQPAAHDQTESPASTAFGGPAYPPAGLPASPPSLEAVRASWPAIVAALKGQNRWLGEALAASQPSALEIPWLTVTMTEPNPLFADRLHEEGARVEEVLSRSLGQAVRLRVTSGVVESTPPAKPKRISESSLKAERLREFRAKDPALDTAADALDLEIVD